MRGVVTLQDRLQPLNEPTIHRLIVRELDLIYCHLRRGLWAVCAVACMTADLVLAM